MEISLVKKVLLLLAILLALGLIAGCAGGSEADDVPADDLITDDSAEEPAGDWLPRARTGAI